MYHVWPCCFLGDLRTIFGCGKQTEKPSTEHRDATDVTKNATTARSSRSSRNDSDKVAKANRKPAKPQYSLSRSRDKSSGPELPVDEEVLSVDLSNQEAQKWSLPRPKFNDERVAVAGIRKISSKHLDLYTDLPSSKEVDELPTVFDLAVSQWCDYFEVDHAKAESWKMIGYVMERKERFAGSGLLPDDLPRFLNGYQRGWQFWVYEQPSAYYRRHLVLHEGTHAFMSWMLGNCGPPWYMEGMAELLATHRWQDGQLQLNYFPRRREEVEQWGRIKIVCDDVQAGRGLSLVEITNYSSTAHLRIEPYGWSWAACAFLDGHPDYQRTFRSLRSEVRDDVVFSQTVGQLLGKHGRRLAEQWQLFTHHLDYGYDIAREAIAYAAERPISQAGMSVHVSAEHGWQSTGIRLQPDVTYVLESSGRYQIGSEPKTWWCEPGGVTIAYYRGQPLGRLLAAVSDPTRPLTGNSPLLTPHAIGLGDTISAGNGGVLFLRINEDPAQWADNAGELLVSIRPE